MLVTQHSNPLYLNIHPDVATVKRFTVISISDSCYPKSGGSGPARGPSHPYSLSEMPDDSMIPKFGPFTVTSQVFHTSHNRLSFALVNLKPLLPGHVLVCPQRVVPRFSELTEAETTDLFLTVRQVGRVLERVYRASSLNIAIQDGVDAGQSVPHVHVHIIPRAKSDLDDRGGSDAIYDMMDGEEGDLSRQFEQRDFSRELREKDRDKSFAGPDAERKPRSEDEMKQEADMLRQEMKGSELD